MPPALRTWPAFRPEHQPPLRQPLLPRKLRHCSHPARQLPVHPLQRRKLRHLPVLRLPHQNPPPRRKLLRQPPRRKLLRPPPLSRKLLRRLQRLCNLRPLLRRSLLPHQPRLPPRHRSQHRPPTTAR